MKTCPVYSIRLSPNKVLYRCRECSWMHEGDRDDLEYSCKGLGWLVTRVLCFFGVTEDRMMWLFGLFGKKCHCHEYRTKLNFRRKR